MPQRRGGSKPRWKPETSRWQSEGAHLSSQPPHQTCPRFVTKPTALLLAILRVDAAGPGISALAGTGSSFSPPSCHLLTSLPVPIAKVDDNLSWIKQVDTLEGLEVHDEDQKAEAPAPARKKSSFAIPASSPEVGGRSSGQKSAGGASWILSDEKRIKNGEPVTRAGSAHPDGWSLALWGRRPFPRAACPSWPAICPLSRVYILTLVVRRSCRGIRRTRWP